MPRDRRFVAAHRGGLLDLTNHQLLASWAASCAERVLPFFTRVHPDDDRPSIAIRATRAWACGEITVGQARQAAVAAHAAARAALDEPARAAARAAGHAVSTAHMADHSLGAAYYAIRALRAAAAAHDAQPAADREHEWQRTMLPGPVRELVISALEEGTVLGDWKP